MRVFSCPRLLGLGRPVAELIFPRLKQLESLQGSPVVDLRVADRVQERMLDRIEQGQLQVPIAPGRVRPCKGLRIRKGTRFRFQLGEDLLRSMIDLLGDTCQAGYVNPVALVGGARDNLVQEDDIVMPFLDVHVQVLDRTERAFKFC